MNLFSFIEIAALRNEVSLFENIRNNLVNFKKTLNSKFGKCCFHLAVEFPIFEHVNITYFSVILPTVFFKILLPIEKQLFQNDEKFS